MSERLSFLQRLRRARVLRAQGSSQPGQSPASVELHQRAELLQQLAARERLLCREHEPDALAALNGPHECQLPFGHRGPHRQGDTSWERDRRLQGRAQLDLGETSWERDDDGWHPTVIRRQRLLWRRRG